MNNSLWPDSGTMYALYIDRVVYKPYDKNELLNDLYLEDKLLELHLFDENKEYRYINSRQEEIEYVVSDEIEYDDVYIEKVYVQEGIDEETNDNSKMVEVVNYIKYDENDLLSISNYRFKEAK